MTPRFERLTIAGVGLVGGSLGGAARAARLAAEVVGFGRSEENLRIALERGLVDRVTRDPAAAVAGADAIVLAVPVGACVALAEVFRPHARAGTLLTDVGSVKAGLVAALESCWSTVGPVVGAHPIAGSEASGAAAARTDLFRGRRCVLTPTALTDPAALARVHALWEGVGARVEEMSPTVHDELLARASHAPHLVAYALASAVGDATVAGRPVLAYAGSGFRDTTRIAGSPAELWRDIALANAPALRAALAEFRAALERLERLVATGDAAGLGAALAAANAARRRLARGPERP
jgi:prephenate dehydrogenase